MRILIPILRFTTGFAFGWMLMHCITTEHRLPALETRVTQLETALKAQALGNEARVQLRENP